MSAPMTDNLPPYSTEYQNRVDNYGKPRIEYVQKVHGMTDEELLKETEHKIWLSAFANNNPRSDYHWHVDVCYSECQYRNKPEIYSKAFEDAKSSAGC